MVRIRSFGPVTQFRMARAALGQPLYWVCAFHVDGLLIDTGCAHTTEEFAAALDGDAVRQVVNTHHHEDHVGGNAALAARAGLRARIHPLGIERLRHPDPHLSLYRRVVWGTPPPCDPEPLGEEISTDRYTFRVIHAPGHSPDQVVLFEERAGWLFGADLYLGERVKYLRRDERLGESLASLRRVAALPVRRPFCSFGAVIDDGQRALAAKLAYWEGLCARVWELAAAGRSPAQIRRQVLGREGLLRWVTGGDFAKQHLVTEALRLAGGLPRAGRGTA
ncbi:MAG: MBL fold metallo-hydrolase [Armatimonadota bacterium]|nr:MBL fold metallo-hydrolase [Armatimonadota bacterium]MDR7518186.1 MBL fold metallo-hydrolase [Armatimonadota bacterium]MDR7548440.1 MBL fold metallo-hydrolase [Armatimonadota bacterium]